MDRPTCEKFASLKTVCLAQFASLCYKKTSSDNDYQPNILEEIIEKENDCNTTLQKKNRSKKVSRSNDYEKSKVSFALL